jgi:2-C-methyl-D-erythritol 2,4-cyclodiphosphate synthase
MNNNFRVGIGFDIHRLVKDLPLMLGGIHIPFHMGLKGHSDGDALIHAIIDSLLGASNLGDIGSLFPSDDPTYKNIDSSKLLQEVFERLKKNHWSIINIDSIIMCEEPKMSPWYKPIKTSLAKLLSINEDAVSVKAKTFEKLGDIGHGTAIAVQAVSLLHRE